MLENSRLSLCQVDDDELEIKNSRLSLLKVISAPIMPGSAPTEISTNSDINFRGKLNCTISSFTVTINILLKFSDLEECIEICKAFEQQTIESVQTLVFFL